jgi:hypothetical protein
VLLLQPLLLQVAVSVSRVLKAYSNMPDLNARMPGFSVQMGFGLHVGWAIEGAIGELAAALQQVGNLVHSSHWPEYVCAWFLFTR